MNIRMEVERLANEKVQTARAADRTAGAAASVAAWQLES
jgi:hypothetical protein